MRSRKPALLAEIIPGSSCLRLRHTDLSLYSLATTPQDRKQAEPPACILIVEDDFVVADEIVRALCDAGFTVAGVATSAEETLELAESQKPALAVMDVRLAGKGDGVHTALETFRKFGIRCILATARYGAVRPTFA
jgi:two-component system, response regulator PdtaR